MKRQYEYDQHFLRSPQLVAELIGHSNLGKNDLVYDFGAGSGVITSVLARRVSRVVAVDNEDGAIAKLNENMAGAKNVSIVRGDALTVSLPVERYKVFANPPFSIISPLIKRLAEAKNPPGSIYLIVQKQFANKIVPSDQRFTSALGIEISPIYSARIRKPLRKTDFTPPPAVDTALLELRARDRPLLEEDQMERFRKFVRASFADPRVFRRLPLADAGVSHERKPSELTSEQWIALYRTQ